MAAGHLKVSSSNTSNKSAIFADFYEINKHQDRRYLSYDGKRFRWAGNLESLKNVVENGVKLLGIWTSPGGSSKMFTCSYLDLGTVQYLLKGRAGGKAKFDEKKLPALRSIK